ncbi:hypothetical protein [Parvularcula bermudensis]|uniref:hypothetical protein n=1 Tax=Parvularcula bermudensis TaxID=208216 RepID=UPI0013050758|nr:hypothetical protein [Parvularcula bermudensis]
MFYLVVGGVMALSACATSHSQGGPSFRDPATARAVRAAVRQEYGPSVRVVFEGPMAFRVKGVSSKAQFEEVAETVWSTFGLEEELDQDPDGAWRPDYYGLADQHSAKLYAYSRDHIGADHGRALAAEVQAHLQRQIRYRIPREGFLPPDEVIRRGYGDCDSKATLAAAMLLSLDPRLDPHFVRLPSKRHVLLAVRVPVQRGDHTVKINGRRYVLMEVAGETRSGLGDLPWEFASALDDAIVLYPGDRSRSRV